MSKSPTLRLLFGLFITVAAVTGFSAYALRQVDGLRRLQVNMIDLNRKDSLQLLRVQNDLNTIDVKLQELVRDRSQHGVDGTLQQLRRLLRDVTQALGEEGKLRLNPRRTERRAELLRALARFEEQFDVLADAKHVRDEDRAQAVMDGLLVPRQAEMQSAVSRMLERNNETEGALDQRVSEIYNGAADDVYILLVGTIITIAVTSLYLIYSNGKLFGQLASLSHQRRVLAGRLITVQEEVLRSVSRELHDEFGQILTAVGAMLTRAERRGIPSESPLRTELSEVREITHQTLEKIRSLSQMLHPAIIDDFGLAKAVEWFTGIFERQTGIETELTVDGDAVLITGQRAIHCFRIVQEALNNAAKHSGSRKAQVSMNFSGELLEVRVTDFGVGLAPVRQRDGNGLGLIAMRERAELLNGRLQISSSPATGTTVAITLPIRPDDAPDERLARPADQVLAESL
jgi:signal transduction histidine kinase